jgi:hypothetical protein
VRDTGIEVGFADVVTSSSGDLDRDVTVPFVAVDNPRRVTGDVVEDLREGSERTGR